MERENNKLQVVRALIQSHFGTAHRRMVKRSDLACPVRQSLTRIGGRAAFRRAHACDLPGALVANSQVPL
jgi:hypothetical protein